MGQPSLEDSFESVERASKDIAKLKRDIAKFRKTHAHSVSEDRDSDGAYVLTVHPQKVPKALRADARDILISNLRPALDYLVQNLAFLDSGKRQRGTQFPICDTPEVFKGRRKTWLKGVDNRHVAAIERLQPYNGSRGFAVLNDLCNPGKHDEITVIDSAISGGYDIVEKMRRIRKVKKSPTPQFKPKPSFAELLAFPRTAQAAPKRETKQVSRISIPPQHPLAKSHVHVHLGLTFYIAFENGLPVVPLLQFLESKVRDALEAFEPEFKR